MQVPTLQRTSGLANGTDLREHFFGLKVARVGTKSLFRILTARELSKEVLSALKSSSTQWHERNYSRDKWRGNWDEMAPRQIGLPDDPPGKR